MGSNMTTELQAEIAARSQMQEVLMNSKTVGGFLDEISSVVDTETLQFLRAKTCDIKKMPVRIEARDKNFTIEIEQHVFQYAIEGQEGGATLARINNKLVAYDPSKPIEQLWNDIQSIMPKTTTSKWPDLLPKAHAFAPILWTAGFVALQTGATAYFTNVHNCQLYKFFNRQCQSGEIGERAVLAVAYFEQSLKGKISLSCLPTRADLRICVKKFIKEKGGTLVIPSELRAYFDLPPETPLNKATANGMPKVRN